MYSTYNRGAGLKSCNALLQRVEDNDPRLTELVILPMKTFGVAAVERLSNAIGDIILCMCVVRAFDAVSVSHMQQPNILNSPFYS